MAEATRPAAPANELREFLGMLSRRRSWVLLPMLAGVVVGFLLARVLPKTYVVTTTLTVRPEPARPGAYLPFAAQDELNTIQAEIKADSLLQTILAEDVAWPEYAALPTKAKRAFLQAMKKRLGVRLLPKWRESGADVVEITYEDSDSGRTSAIANAIRRRWAAVVLERQTREVETDLQRAIRERDARLAEYDLALDAERKIREAFGLPLKRKADRDPERDPVMERADRIERELGQRQIELAGVKALLPDLRRKLEEVPKEILLPPPEPTTDPEVRRQVEEIDARILGQRRELEGKKPPHPDYQKAQQEIERLQALREGLVGDPEAPRPEVPTPNPERKALEAKVFEAEGKAKQLEAQIAELTRSLGEVEGQVQARHAAYASLEKYELDTDAARDRFDRANDKVSTFTEFHGRLVAGEENPFIDLQEAWPPQEAVSPDVAVVIGLSVFFGLGAGLLLAAMREYGGTGLRTMEDAVRSLSVPVLGAVQWVVTEVERRQRRRRRVVTIGATSTVTLLLAALVLVYALRPEGLPAPVTRLLDTIRHSLRL